MDCCDSAAHLINNVLGRIAGLADLHFCRKLSDRVGPDRHQTAMKVHASARARKRYAPDHTM
jgi:hypothetical protein